MLSPDKVATDTAQRQIEAVMVDQIFHSLPAILVNLTLMPMAVCLVMWGRVPVPVLMIWLGMTVAVLVARYLLAYWYVRRTPVAGDYRRWAGWFTATSLVSGLTWGYAGWAFFPPGSPSVQVFIDVCIVGLAAGSIIVTSYWLRAYYAYAIPSIAISALRLWVEGGLEYQSLSILLLMYLVIVSRVAHLQHRTAREATALRFANLDLVEQVQREKQAVEAANRDLDQRVQLRTIELQSEVFERRKAELQLDKLAHQDPLTALPNRRMFALQLNQRLQDAERGQKPFAILFIDLDRFKEINDTLGHTLGDHLLIAVARRLQPKFGAQDTLARLGGDEFICLLEDTGSRAAAQHVAEQLIRVVSSPFSVAGHTLYIAASIGICLYPQDGGDVDTLIRNADTAMYRAKAHGRGRCHFYTAEMTAEAQERIHLDTLLRHAMEAGQLAVHYQLKVDAARQPCGAEALLRWNCEGLGSVAPAKFIPLAEETGFIVPLGDWVLQQTCRQIAAWQKAGIVPPRIAINLSVKQLEHGNMVPRLKQLMAENEVAPDRLELEVTESIIMNAENGAALLQEIAALGIKLAVDDFGTGYSSLAYLKTLPIHILKIDRSFVSGIGYDTGDEAIIHTIIGLAKSLGLITVAEGVETIAQYDFLKTSGVDEMQGFYFGRPDTPEALLAHWPP